MTREFLNKELPSSIERGATREFFGDIHLNIDELFDDLLLQPMALKP